MMDKFEQFQKDLFRKKLYRIAQRSLKVFLIALFVLEIGGVVLLSAKYGFSRYLLNFWEVQYFLFGLQVSVFFWIFLAGDLVFGQFLRYIKQDEPLSQKDYSEQDKRMLSHEEYFQQTQSKQTTLVEIDSKYEMKNTAFIKKD